MVADTVKFLDNTAPMQVRVTTTQQIVNMNDHKDVALVFDMRSEKQFAQSSLDKSVNLPIEKFNEEIFINWAKHTKRLEADTSIFKTKAGCEVFKRRRRRWVYIIPVHDSKNLY